MKNSANRKILIGGTWRSTDRCFSVRNPYNGDLIADVCSASESDIEDTIAFAQTASLELRETTRFELAKALAKISDLIEKRKDEFANTIVNESAKPISLARAEVERASRTFHFAAIEVEKFVGEIIPIDAQSNGRGKTGHTMQVPLGVIFGITPFNFPLNLVAHKIAPALASRNSIIIKPSPRTPLTALLLGEIFLESGLPGSAVQIVPMDVALIDIILRDERVHMLSFTGSAEVGWNLKSRIGRKKLALELGGNAPVIVDETADYQRSIDQTLIGAFAFAGQVCISVQRVYVHQSFADAWMRDFVSGAKILCKGNPAEETTKLSVMIDEPAAIRAKQWIDEAIGAGAVLLCGGTRDSSFLDATVLTNTSSEMRVVSEEAFAPVVVLEKFSHIDEAFSMANQTKYGLQCGIFTQNLANARRATEQLEFGSVLINEIPTFRVDNMPYGGVKSSGFGREGVRYAMEEMSERRLVVMSD